MCLTFTQDKFFKLILIGVIPNWRKRPRVKHILGQVADRQQQQRRQLTISRCEKGAKAIGAAHTNDKNKVSFKYEFRAAKSATETYANVLSKHMGDFLNGVNSLHNNVIFASTPQTANFSSNTLPDTEPVRTMLSNDAVLKENLERNLHENSLGKRTATVPSVLNNLNNN